MNRKHLVSVVSFATLWLVTPILPAQTVVTQTNNGGGLNDIAAEYVPPRDAGGTEVGISGRDGITYSAPDVLITKNGVTHRLTKSLRLANGSRVMPDGRVILAGGSTVLLRAEQVLNFSGTFDDAPIVEAVVDEKDAAANVAGQGPVILRSRPASRVLTK